jgi:hypothetical protein
MQLLPPFVPVYGSKCLIGIVIQHHSPAQHSDVRKGNDKLRQKQFNSIKHPERSHKGEKEKIREQ